MRIRSLERSDVRDGFRCGAPSLDRFLECYAWQNQARYRLGVTYVAVDDATRRVVGYFTLAAASVSAEESSVRAPGGYAEIPCIRIARLAVDERVQGIGLGGELVRAALTIALAESERVGCAGVIVDAMPEAVGFYERFGFHPMEVRAGTGAARPRPTLMWLGIGTVLRAGK
ncbi:MAG: GNAT family N-acetyltransferase [Coriobacteriia bacterium]|nr:GNAT family N-acetyltransferase [Coriobacteriia bacterium]